MSKIQTLDGYSHFLGHHHSSFCGLCLTHNKQDPSPSEAFSLFFPAFSINFFLVRELRNAEILSRI